jgi:hypothetical protein
MRNGLQCGDKLVRLSSARRIIRAKTVSSGGALILNVVFKPLASADRMTNTCEDSVFGRQPSIFGKMQNNILIQQDLTDKCRILGVMKGFFNKII